MPWKKPKYDHLLQDDGVRRWYENLAARSVITATVYKRTLGLYCQLNDTTPKALLQLAMKDDLSFRDSFSDFVRELEKEGKAGSYIARFKKVLLSWLRHNGLDTKLNVNIRGESDTPSIAEERIPTKDELSRILRQASPRGRIEVALMAFSGLRPESLGDYLGSDGLVLGDFAEALIHDDRMEFQKAPTILRIRKTLSKARHTYFTFVPSETLTYVQEYLQTRVNAGKKLTPTTPLLIQDPRGRYKRNAFLSTGLVTRDIREAMSKAGLRWRPYVLRAYFDTNMILAESKGLVSHPFLQFFMGHKGDMEARYSTNKGRLPQEMVDEMREAYTRCLPVLLHESRGMEDMMSEFRKQLLLVAGFKDEEISKLSLQDMTNEDFQRTVRERLLGTMANNGLKQKVVQASQIENFIGQGWEFVSMLPNDSAIVKLPF